MKTALPLLTLTALLAACAAPTPIASPPIGLTAGLTATAPPVTAPPASPTISLPTPTHEPPTSVPPTPTLEPIGAVVFLTDQADHPAAGALQSLGVQVRPSADLPRALTAAQVIITEALDPATARAAPQVRFIVLGASSTEEPNALGLPANFTAWRPDQIGLLAGAAAGFATPAQRVAALGDPTSPSDLAYRAGFQNGARLTCPRCRIDLVDLPADLTAAGDLAVQYARFGAQVILAPPTPAGQAATRRAAQAGAWVVDLTGTLTDTDRVLAVFFTADPLTRVVQAALQTDNPDWQTAAAPLRWPPASPLGAMDRHEVATLAAQLRTGDLDTGIDPITGLEK